MNDAPRDPELRSPGSLLRDVALLVVVGIALGVTHNAYMLSAGPGRGVPWIRQERQMVRLDDIAPAGPGSPAANATPAGDPAGTATPSPAAAPPPGTPATTHPGEAHARPSASPGTTPGTTTSPAAGAAAAEPAPASAPPVAQAPPLPEAPVIPESREPIEAGLAVVRGLYEAKAALFVDARTAGEYAEGHIADATNLSFDDVFRDPALLERLDDRGRPIVVYCGGGDCDVSRNLAFTIVDAGRKRVLVFLGGLPEWQTAGLPVRTGPQP